MVGGVKNGHTKNERLSSLIGMSIYVDIIIDLRHGLASFGSPLNAFQSGSCLSDQLRNYEVEWDEE